MISKIFNLSLAFYMVFSAPGSIPVFMSSLKHFSKQRQKQLIIRECLLALITLVLFVFFSGKIFQFLGIAPYSFPAIGGVLLFIVSFRMFTAPLIVQAEETHLKSEPLFFPLAFPIITGPAVITTTLVYLENIHFSTQAVWIGVLIAWFLSTLTLLSSSFFNRILGPSGLFALERIFSIIILLISVDLVLKGISVAFNIGYYANLAAAS